MSEKKGIATPYLVAIILGIIIIGAITYMFINQIGIFTRTGLEQQCRSKEVIYCNEKPADVLFTSFAPECAEFGWAMSVSPDSLECQRILVQSALGGGLTGDGGTITPDTGACTAEMQALATLGKVCESTENCEKNKALCDACC